MKNTRRKHKNGKLLINGKSLIKYFDLLLVYCLTTMGIATIIGSFVMVLKFFINII